MDFSFIFGRDSGRWSQAINPFDRLRTGIARAIYTTTQPALFAKTIASSVHRRQSGQGQLFSHPAIFLNRRMCGATFVFTSSPAAWYPKKRYTNEIVVKIKIRTRIEAAEKEEL